MNDPDMYGTVPWTFTAAESNPRGIRVEVVITVDPGPGWKDLRELGAVAQGAAHEAMTKAIDSERCPF